MKLFIKFDINLACKKLLQEQLEKFGLTYSSLSFGEVEIKENLSNEDIKQLNNNLSEYGIEIIENHKTMLIQKIKDAIIEMVFIEEKLPISKISSYLADKLNHSYGYMSNLFSEVTYTSIENYIILQKIERAKQLLITNEFTISEIAFKLNYSSVPHFSTQFKNATGLTPTVFLRIINKRRNNL